MTDVQLQMEPGAERYSEVYLVSRVHEAAQHWAQIAEAHFHPETGRFFPKLDVSFALKGRAAGSARYLPLPNRAEVRINRDLLLRYPRRVIGQTVPHEIAHVAAGWRYGPRIKPHGREWRFVMQTVFGKVADTCHEMQALPANPTNYAIAHCGCDNPHFLPPRKALAAQVEGRLRCGRCKQSVVVDPSQGDNAAILDRAAKSPNTATAACGCPNAHPITKQRAARMRKGTRYRCRACGEPLRLVDARPA